MSCEILTTRCLTFSTANRRYGLTLVELLVVIVILVTLVAGVVPVLSPNNDERKIREASRGLQSYITLTQARAARTGRPQGIALRESSAGSGVALEVLGLEVPPPFAGFSTESRCRVRPRATAPFNYVAGRFAKYNNFLLYNLQFVLSDGTTADELPPRTFQIGDRIEVGGNEFLIVETPDNNGKLESLGTVQYLGSPSLPADNLDCVWINNNGQVPPQGLRTYQIQRQAKNSSESPYQLPAGIVIDLQGSVVAGTNTGGWPTGGSLYSLPGNQDFVGIMFSPTGAVSSLFFNNRELQNVSRLTLLLGRIENGGFDPGAIDLADVQTIPWRVQSGEKIEDVQQRVNWLNLDSRLLTIAANNGRTTVSETAFVNPSQVTAAANQIQAAQEFAREMNTAR